MMLYISLRYSIFCLTRNSQNPQSVHIPEAKHKRSKCASVFSVDSV